MPDGINQERRRRIPLDELRGDLIGFLGKVQEGESFLITSDDRVLAEIRPAPSATPIPREPGVLQGRIWMAPDFDELPPDVLDAMEGEV